jgi:methionyl-tRNA formyltransferase
LSLAYLGTSDFAAGVLAGLTPDLVVTRPDRPAGRGKKLTPPPVAVAAKERGLALEQPDDVHQLALDAYDDVVVCAFGAWIKEPLLSHPGLINVHPSLLPRWRGAAPIERAIMAGDAETGVCLMRMTAELDEGPVHLVERTPIGPDEDFGAVSVRLQGIATSLLQRWLAGERPPAVEQEGESTYAEKITAADRALDPARPPEENARVVRALSPHLGAKAGDLGVWQARVGDDGPLTWHGLELLVVQPPGKRPMAAADYARGR